MSKTLKKIAEEIAHNHYGVLSDMEFEEWEARVRTIMDEDYPGADKDKVMEYMIIEDGVLEEWLEYKDGLS